jgi:hypothetical protein
MNCIKCGSANTHEFFKEMVPCSHCDEETEVTFFNCPDCGLMWKFAAGKVFGDSGTFLAEEDFMWEEEDFLREMEEAYLDESPISDEELARVFAEFDDFIRKDLNLGAPATMTSMLHHCLRCNALAYEVLPHSFQCSACDFSWEVIR